MPRPDLARPARGRGLTARAWAMLLHRSAVTRGQPPLIHIKPEALNRTYIFHSAIDNLVPFPPEARSRTAGIFGPRAS